MSSSPAVPSKEEAESLYSTILLAVGDPVRSAFEEFMGDTLRAQQHCCLLLERPLTMAHNKTFIYLIEGRMQFECSNLEVKINLLVGNTGFM
jgi:hypothetical protein